MKLLFRIISFFLAAVLAIGATPQAIQRNPVTLSPSNHFNFTGVVTNGAVANQKLGFDGTRVGWLNDLTAGTGATVWENGLAVNDPNFATSSTAVIDSAGTNISVYPTNLGAAQLATDSVSADELNALGVEAELELVLDLADLQGAVTDGQVPDNITINQATLALTGDSALGFFGAGQLERARGGTAADTSAFGTGLFASDAGNNTIDADTLAELLTAVGTTGTPTATNFWRGDNSFAQIALGTDTTGNYAAGDAESGAALTGDTATGFFTVGQIELARGGTGVDASGFASGLFGMNSGTFVDVDSVAEFSTALGITGTPDGTKFLRDDFVWAVPPGGAGGDSMLVNSTAVNTSGSITNTGTMIWRITAATPDLIEGFPTNITSAQLATDSVSADELDAGGVESELEAVLDLADLQGTLTRAKGGTGTDTSSFGAGLFGSDGSNNTIDVDTEAELETALGAINVLVATEVSSLAQLDTLIGITGTPGTSNYWRGDNAWSRVALATDVTGNLAVTNLNSGTSASATTYWRGDTTWATPVLSDLAGSVTDAQVPNSITIDLATLATTATTANAGDSATAFFTSGQIERARGGTGADTSAFGSGLFGSDGSNNTIDVDTIAELETALAGVNVIVSTEIDSSAELAGLLGDETGTGAVAFSTMAFLTNVIEFASWATLGTDVDPDANATFYKQLTGNLTLTFSNFSDGQWARLFLENDNVGGFSITWPANTIFLSPTNAPTATAVTIDTNALSINRFLVFRRNGTNFVEGPFSRDSTNLTWIAALPNQNGTVLGWTGGYITNVPSAGSTAWDDIGDPDADTTIAFAAFETDFTSTLDSNGKAIWTITNTDADTAADTSFLEMRHNDSVDANVIYLQFVGDNDGTPVTDLRFDQTLFQLGSGISFRATTAAIFDLTVTNSFSVLGTLSVGSLVVTNPVNTLIVTNLYLTNASPSQYVMTDADRKLVTSATVNDDDVAFDDADSNWTATSVGPALEELDDVINGGVPNSATAKVDWSQLFNVPAGFADGTDDGGAGATAINDIGDATADGSVTQGAHEMDFVSTIDAANEAVWTITNTDADGANDTSFLDLRHNDGGDANVIYLQAIGDNDGTPITDLKFDQTLFRLGTAITLRASTTFLNDLTVTNSFAVLGTLSVGSLVVTNPVSQLYVTNLYLTNASPSQYVVTDSERKLVTQSTINDDDVAFDDADGNWTATSVGPALEELDDVINGGVPNSATAKVDWSQLFNVPAGFADGTDDGAGGATAINDIGDATADGSIAIGANEIDFTSTIDASGEAIWTLTNTDADAANDNSFIDLRHNDGADANVFYARFIGDNDGSPVNDYLFSQTAMTVGSGITANFAGTLQEGGNDVFNSSETPGGELGGTWASPTVDDSLTVATWTMTGAPGLTLANAATSAGVLRIDEDDDDGANFLEQSIAALSANRTITWRDASGTPLLSGDTLTGEVTATFDTDGSTATVIADSVTVATWTMTGAPGLSLNNGATGPGVLRILEDSDLGSSFAEITVGDLSGNTIYRLPLDDGDAGEQLQTDGSGNLTWEAPGGAATGWSDIGDATGDATIDLVSTQTDFTSTQDGGAIWRITDTDANAAVATIMIDLAHNTGADAELAYFRAIGDSDGTPTTDYLFSQTVFRVHPSIVGEFGGTFNVNDLMVTNSFSVLGTLSVASLVVTNPVNNLYVTNLYLTNGTASRAVFTDSNRKLVTTGASADLAGALSDEVGTVGGFVRAEWTDTAFIPVTAMIDGSAAPGPLRDFTDTRKIKVRSFTNTTDNVTEFAWQPPLDITDGDTGTGDFQIKWRPIYIIETTAASAGQGTVFGLSAGTGGDNDDFGVSVGSESDHSIADLSGYANGDWVQGSTYSTLTFTGFASGEFIQFSLRRDQAAADDDYAQGVALVGIQLKFQRTVGGVTF